MEKELWQLVRHPGGEGLITLRRAAAAEAVGLLVRGGAVAEVSAVGAQALRVLETEAAAGGGLGGLGEGCSFPDHSPSLFARDAFPVLTRAGWV